MKKTNNWKLIALLGILVVIFMALRIFRSPKLESNLPAVLTKIDSVKVTEIVILSARERARDIRIVRVGKRWDLIQGDRKGRIEQGGGVNALRLLMNLKPQRIVSKKREKWNDFNVGDSSGTHVKVMAGNSTEADLWIGRAGFTQMPGPGGQFGGESFTHVRLNGEDEVYTVEGFLEAQFNRGFNDWRDKSFTRLNRDSVNRITFRYPADSSFVLEKKNGKWTSDSALADSAAVTSYLNGLQYKNLSGFADTPPVGEAPVVIIFGQNARTVAKLEAWISPGSWSLRSSLQPDTFFSSPGLYELKDVFKGKKELLGQLPKKK